MRNESKYSLATTGAIIIRTATEQEKDYDDNKKAAAKATSIISAKTEAHKYSSF